MGGAIWFGTYSGGAAHFDSANWTVYDTSNSGLPSNEVWAIAIDADGATWFATDLGGVARFDGSTWTVYNTTNSDLPDNHVWDIAIEDDGTKWFGTYEGGVGVLYGGQHYSMDDNPQWLGSSHYGASHDFTTLVPRDAYSLTISGAVGSDGIEIAPNTAHTFTVDYAGAIADTTPPHTPSVTAWGDETATILSARWSASDPDSAITLYRYAIGTTPGGTEVVNWTSTGEAEVVRSGLTLLAGQTYYVSAKARNEGGLWSDAGVSNGVVAGETTTPPILFLPLICKGA